MEGTQVKRDKWVSEWMNNHSYKTQSIFMSFSPVTMTRDQGCSLLCLHFYSTFRCLGQGHILSFSSLYSMSNSTNKLISCFLLSITHNIVLFFSIVHFVSLSLFCCTFETQFTSWLSVLRSYSHNISVDNIKNHSRPYFSMMVNYHHQVWEAAKGMLWFKIYLSIILFPSCPQE